MLWLEAHGIVVLFAKGYGIFVLSIASISGDTPNTLGMSLSYFHAPAIAHPFFAGVPLM